MDRCGSLDPPLVDPFVSFIPSFLDEMDRYQTVSASRASCHFLGKDLLRDANQLDDATIKTDLGGSSGCHEIARRGVASGAL